MTTQTQTVKTTTLGRIELVGPDSTDLVDLYADGKLAIPALTHDERTALFFHLAALDAAVEFPYDVHEIRSLDLPHAWAMIHDARVRRLTVWHDGEHIVDHNLDPRWPAARVMEEAEKLAADVRDRIRNGDL